MNSRYRAIIGRAMRFDLRRVCERYANEYESSLEEANVLALELKRYLTLRALHPRTSYGMAGPTDKLWHTFLLFTRQYAHFCEHVAGRFIHHTPGATQNARQLRQFKQDYANLWRDYEVVFGERPPSSVWPALEAFENPNEVRRSRHRKKEVNREPD